MKIGIMGGTFDPIHSGHIKTARKVMEQIGLKEILFIPSGIPAHKKDRKITNAGIRYEMIEAAINDYKDFKISDMEIKRGGYTYTVDTLRQLHNEKDGKVKLVYIIGADVVLELDTWKEYKEVFKLCSFAVIPRPGYSKETFNSAIKKAKALGADITVVEVPQYNISSSEIRGKVKIGVSVEELTPVKVIEIIKRESLYDGRIDNE